MANRNGSTKPEANPIRLLLTEKRGGGYYHLTARVVEIRPADDRGVSTWGRIRNIDVAGGRYVDDLEITGRGSDEDRTRSDLGRHLYAWCIEYAPFSVDLVKAERMVRTLKGIEQAIERQASKIGRPLSFGQYLGRVATALGCAGFVTVTRDGHSGSYDDDTHRYLSIAEGIDYADHLARVWAAEGTEVHA